MNYQLSQNVELFIEKEGGVLYDKSNEQFFGLDFVGCLICEQIEKGLDFESIVLFLSKKYNISVDIIHEDASQFITKMLEKSLICQKEQNNEI